jgi:predicted  nucleic acid-binding Zn-ribbon protein
MTTPRRRIIRSHVIPSTTDQERQRSVQRLRVRLDRERAALARWQTRMRRAFNAVLKHQTRIARLERQIARQED